MSYISRRYHDLFLLVCIEALRGLNFADSLGAIAIPKIKAIAG